MPTYPAIAGTSLNYRTKRTNSQSFTSGATAVTVTWPTPFADTNYTVTGHIEAIAIHD
jgi:hypothetical protein